MGYDWARECQRSTEVNGRGFRNTDMDHYTTARFKGERTIWLARNEGGGKEDGRGLPEVKAGKVFDKSGRRTEDGSQVRRPEYSDVGGSVRTTENDGKPNNVNNQSKTFYSNSGEPERSGEDWNVKPEEDRDEQMIIGSHPVVVWMSSGDEPEVNRRRPGVGREITGGYRNVDGCIPEYTGSGRMSTRMIGKESGGKGRKNPDVKEDRRLRPDEPVAEARSHVRRRKCRRVISREKPEFSTEWREEERQRKLLKAEVELPHRRREFEPEDERHPESGGLSWKRLTFARVRVGDPANTEGMNEGGREPGVQRKSRKKAKVTITDEWTSPIARPEVVGEIVAKLFRSRNPLPVCSTVEPEQMEVTEWRCKPEVLRMSRECGDENRGRGRHYMRLRNKIHIGELEDQAGKPGSCSANGNGGKGEGKPDGMPEQLPEEGTEGTEDAGKDVGHRASAGNFGKWRRSKAYAGYVKSEMDRPGGESEVDSTHQKFAGTMSVIVLRVRHGKPEPERTGEFGKPEIVRKSAEIVRKSRSMSRTFPKDS
ncbi:hypothetical protein K438DRAFT_1949083 [Mycena galopus ATCC 62051]|nr:hypothetical protein K438DRAFT_1949083 [Mycena galopus ATCC 62051]